ncbi:fumarylacetoacetate hydrolase family protein [Vibrio sp. SM6]|uniref:Fumarylacetoacetate hydrolase family protein n=1 Tax=Vibrio agarilyticus TaxID=2726741 RepID=A0A7X8TTJ6_9VIBR|nr:fumarylacetoacetate hydrolase family protein [Vibrio agarilyticus]NLS14556.1 fumarylacetoacetate hydrolase family protein [Vibrio agarilyticus]
MKSIYCGEERFSPSKLVCVGRNYLAHIEELGNAIPTEMVLFNKPNSAITQTLFAMHNEQRLHYEVEIAFLIKNSALFGVGLALDLTKRELQSHLKSQGLPWERAKAFDGSALLSRFIPLEALTLESLQVELFINCVRVQCGDVTQMIYSPHTILHEVQCYTHLIDGDVLLTGTPKGVGEVQVGDVFLARLKSGDKTLIETEWLAQ